jgi:hypothetical protein
VLAGVKSGEVRQVHEAGAVPTGSWLKGGKYQTATRFVVGVPAGEYEVRVGLRDPGTKGGIEMPLAGRRADGAYAVGRIVCQER